MKGSRGCGFPVRHRRRAGRRFGGLMGGRGGGREGKGERLA